MQYILLCCALWFANVNAFVIMLDPAGDARTPGRVIDDAYESTITLAFCKALQRSIQYHDEVVSVLIVRTAHDTLKPFQTAQSSNTCNVDLHVRIQCYKETGPQQTIFLYQFFFPDDCITRMTNKTVYTYDQAHLMHEPRTSAYVSMFKKNMNTMQNIPFHLQGIYRIPCKPLLGITAPAFLLEISLKSPHAWQELVTPIAQSLMALAREKRV